jgi:hypothetical protein
MRLPTLLNDISCDVPCLLLLLLLLLLLQTPCMTVVTCGRSGWSTCRTMRQQQRLQSAAC